MLIAGIKFISCAKYTVELTILFIDVDRILDYEAITASGFSCSLSHKSICVMIECVLCVFVPCCRFTGPPLSSQCVSDGRRCNYLHMLHELQQLPFLHVANRTFKELSQHLHQYISSFSAAECGPECRGQRNIHLLWWQRTQARRGDCTVKTFSTHESETAVCGSAHLFFLLWLPQWLLQPHHTTRYASIDVRLVLHNR